MTATLNGTGVTFSNGTAQTSAWTGAKKVILTSSDPSWVVPPGVTAVYVTCIGGGGAGGGAATNYYGGYGGAAGAIAAGNITGLVPGTNIPITVGAGGVGVVGAGPSGGTSSFGSYLTATGGAGGSYNISGAPATPNAAVGGTASGSALLFGFTGGYGGRTQSTKGGTFGGSGGSINLPPGSSAPGPGNPSGNGTGVLSFFVGYGGVGKATSQGAGGAGSGYGAGGGGAFRINTSYAGGNGRAGVVILEY